MPRKRPQPPPRPVEHATEDAASTRERLLEAAGEVFAAEGFQGATVRRICQRAGANVAAINYHFGDKDRLYREVLRFAMASMDAAHPIPRLPADASLEERLLSFVRAFLTRLFTAGRRWQGRVLTRELAEPTPALEEVVESHMRPLLDGLDRIVAQACPLLSEEQRRLHTLSLLAQCVFFRHGRPVLDVLYGPEAYAHERQVPALAEHIVTTFLRGLGLRPAPGGAA